MDAKRQRRNSSRLVQPSSRDRLPKGLPRLNLRHGQVLWLLAELGYRGSATQSAFFEYVKALRKLGIPFGSERFQTEHGKRLARYSYVHLMELAIALSLRVYHIVPDAVLKGIIRHRKQLNRFYRRAYAQRDSHFGNPILVQHQRHKSIDFRGLFLDLNIAFAGGRLERFGPPELLSPAEALQRFAQLQLPSQVSIPLNLSLLSEQVVGLALRAPEVQSGPPKNFVL